MKILYVGYRDWRHSKYGGYDWITGFPNTDYLKDEQVLFKQIKMGQSGKFINLFFLDMKARFLRKKYDIVHYFYGDLTMFCKYKKHKNKRIIATIHLDTEKPAPHHENIINILKTVDKIIVLNSQQRDFLIQKYNLPAVFIPHGFNKPIFEKKDIKSVLPNYNKSIINIVTIGKQYRDYETLEKVVRTIQSDRIHFYLLGLDKTKKELFQNLENVTICPRLDDDYYYSVIDECDWAFLPLTFATANNALMESQYLGKRIILPNISGVTDYASPNENFFYNSFDELINFINGIKKQTNSIYLSQYAEKYSWQNVYKILSELYEDVMEHN